MLQLSPTSITSALPFRIWSPPDDRNNSYDDFDTTGLLSLRQAFNQFVLPTLVADKTPRSTIDQYNNALGHWERLMEGNPTLREIDDDLMDVFRGKADAAASTCNKWFRHLRAILNRMGPRLNHNRRSRRNRRYFDEVPYLEDLPEAEPNPIEMPDRQIDALYNACDVATWPPKKRTGCDSSTWWRFSLVFIVNYGPRRDDWRWLSRSTFNFERKEFSYRAKKTGKVHHLVMNDAFLSHLALLPATSDLVFSPTKANKQLYREWHKIQAAAGVRRDDGQPYGFHDLRQTAASRYNDHAPGTAEMLLGHSLPREAQVTAKFYTGKQRLKPLWRAIETIPQPASFRPVIDAFRARPPIEDPNQRKLF